MDLGMQDIEMKDELLDFTVSDNELKETMMGLNLLSY